MNLTEEERQVGIENFRAVIGSAKMSGKTLKETVASELRSKHGLGAHYYGYGKVDKPIRVGVIGTGDEGSVLIGSLNPDYVEVVAIADIRPYNIYRAFYGDKSSKNTRRVRPGLMKLYGWADEKTARENVKVYTNNYEELLDDENVEAVIVALPLHLHAEASIKALRKGKHVLCEKLMAHDVHQCKEMARVAKETGKLLAVGHQRHYSVLYANAVEVIKSGLIGDIHHIRAQWHRGNLPGNDSWQQPLPYDSMRKDLEAATKKLDEQAPKLIGVQRKTTGLISKLRGGLKVELKADQVKLFDKWDAELAALPDKTDGAVCRIKSLAGSNKTLEIDDRMLFSDIFKQTERVSKVQKAYMDRLGKLKISGGDKKALKKLVDEVKKRTKNVNDVKDRVELLINRVKDNEIAQKVEDYGYQSRTVGGKEITALEELIRWRLWDRTGGGLMAELGSHQLDAAGIFVSAQRKDGEKARPLSVTAVGGRHIFDHDRDIDDHVYCSFEFPAPDYDPEDADKKHKKVVVSYSSINGNGFGGYGEVVLGTKGTLIIHKEKDVMLFKGSDTSTYVKLGGDKGRLRLDVGANGSREAQLAGLAVEDPASRGYTEEIEHWAWAIRTPDGKVPLRCNPKIALADAVIALTTNLVMRGPDAIPGDNVKQGRVDFDPAWFDADSDATPEGVVPDVNRKEYQV